MIKTPKKETFPENLKILRIMSGLTQKELAQKINHSQNTISNWESGKKCPDVYVMFELCSIFDVDANQICGYSKCPKIESFVVKTKEFEAEIELINHEQDALDKRKNEATKRLMKYQELLIEQFKKKGKNENKG